VGHIEQAALAFVTPDKLVRTLATVLLQHEASLLLKAEMHCAAHKQPYIQAALELTSMCMSHHNLLKAAVTIDCN